MTKLPKSNTAAQICEEWSKDFEQKKMYEDAKFWLEIANQFKIGSSITENTSSAIKLSINTRIEAAKGVLNIPAVSEALSEIAEEAQRLKKITGF